MIIRPEILNKLNDHCLLVYMSTLFISGFYVQACDILDKKTLFMSFTNSKFSNRLKSKGNYNLL